MLTSELSASLFLSLSGSLAILTWDRQSMLVATLLNFHVADIATLFITHEPLKRGNNGKNPITTDCQSYALEEDAKWLKSWDPRNQIDEINSVCEVLEVFQDYITFSETHFLFLSRLS